MEDYYTFSKLYLVTLADSLHKQFSFQQEMKKMKLHFPIH